MPQYVPINIKPGIDNERPSLTSEPAWRSCDKIRFKNGQPEKIGGWVQATTDLVSFSGVARSIHSWRLNNGVILTAIGTNEKLHLFRDGIVTDITPLRLPAAQDPGTDKIAAASGSAILTITHTLHGSLTGDYVTIAGAVMQAASVVDAEVNANHQITVTDANTYTITVATAATGTDANDGGASVTIDYEISIGTVGNTSAFGYGAGPYGKEAYGDERTISGLDISLRIWSLDNFGEDLVACPSGGRIYRWAYVGLFTNRADLQTNSPTYSDFIVVTSPDRHLVAFASESTGTQDRLLVVWADRETTNTWTPTAENTAGDQPLGTGGKLITSLKTQSATMLWTDVGMHSMQHTGSPFTFGFTEIGTHCGAISRSCVVSKDTTIYWMGKDNFYVYDGVVKVLSCPVHRSVFKNIRTAQISKVVGGLIEEFNEVIWFYPSDASGENDSYVIYNHVENIWYTGTIIRTAWDDSELTPQPLGINASGSLFDHELGVDDNGAAITAFIESSDFDIENGDKAYLISELTPDMSIVAGSVDYIFKTKRYPQATLTTDTTSTVSASTENIDLRIRTKILSIRIESDALSDDWRMGVPYLAIRPDGGRA